MDVKRFWYARTAMFSKPCKPSISWSTHSTVWIPGLRPSVHETNKAQFTRHSPTRIQMKRKLLSLFGASTLALSLAGGAHAADFPSQPITWIVPYAAGGGSDVTARSVAEVLAGELNTNI